MAEPSPRARGVRNGKDANGPKQNREGKARRGKAYRHGAQAAGQAHGGKPGKPLEAHISGQGSKTVLWEWRCAELNYPHWRRRFGPVNAQEFAKQQAEYIDHDEARVMAFGGKQYILELRRNANMAPLSFTISGFPIYKYRAYKSA